MARPSRNMFEMGSDLGDGWESDNKEKAGQKQSEKTMPPEKHLLHFAKEKRRGKTVTIVKPFHLTKSELKTLLKQLKSQLGTGGTLRENMLEFQGELQEKLKTVLKAMGYRFKP